MKKFSFMFIAMFLSIPAFAKICMMNEPTILVNHTQLEAELANYRAEITALRSEIKGLKALPSVWLSIWINASGTLSNSRKNTNGHTWSVTADHDGTGPKTVSGTASCYIGDPGMGESRTCTCTITSPISKSTTWNYQCSTGTCQTFCATCVQSGSYGECTRKALLG